MPPSPPGARRSVTIVDVARAAGVSHSTVSRVLNGRPNISPTTRSRVEEAARRLGYVADLRARGLAGGRLGVVGLVVHNLESPYLHQLVQAVDGALADHGIDLMLSTTQRRDRQSTSVDRMSSGLVDGILLHLRRGAEDYATELLARRFPFVLLDHHLDPRADSVGVDNGSAPEVAAEHLAQLGHRRVACITGRLDVDAGRERLDGWRRAVRTTGLDPDPTLVVRGDFEYARAVRATHELLDLDDPPTAIFASSDAAGLGVLTAAAERNLRVPDELSVVGFDDVPVAASVSPGLTTVRQDLAAHARRAVDLLLTRYDQPDRAGIQERHPGTLVVRGSTGPAPRRSDRIGGGLLSEADSAVARPLEPTAGS